MNEINREELERTEGQLLPDREAMSLMSVDPTQGDAWVATYGDAAGLDGMTPANDAATEAEGVQGTDAGASTSEGESTTSEDRSETISQTDSAYSET